MVLRDFTCYSDYYSELTGSLPVGADMWAQVDAVNLDTDHSGVLETLEARSDSYNNLEQIILDVSVKPVGDGTPEAAMHEDELPARLSRSGVVR